MKYRKLIFLLSVLAVFLAGVLYFGNNIRKSVAQKVSIKADYYFNGGEYNLDKAQKLYQISFKINPNIKLAHYQLGRIYFLNGDFDKALAQFDLELKNNSDFSKIYYMRGLTNGYKGDLEQAVKDFEKFLESNPESWAGNNDLTWIYLKKEDYEEAEKTARRGLEISPENSWLHSNLGIALLNLGNYEESGREMSKALELAEKLTPADWSRTYPGNNPQIAESGLKEMKAGIYLNLAILAKKQSNRQEAGIEYDKYLNMLQENDARKIPFDVFMLMP